MKKIKKLTKAEKARRKKQRKQEKLNREYERLLSSSYETYRALGGANYVDINQIFKTRSINPNKQKPTKQDIKKLKKLATYSGMITALSFTYFGKKGKDIEKQKQLWEKVRDIKESEKKRKKKPNISQCIKNIEAFIFNIFSAVENAPRGTPLDYKLILAIELKNEITRILRNIINSDDDDIIKRCSDIIIDFIQKNGEIIGVELYDLDEYLFRFDETGYDKLVDDFLQIEELTTEI